MSHGTGSHGKKLIVVVLIYGNYGSLLGVDQHPGRGEAIVTDPPFPALMISSGEICFH